MESISNLLRWFTGGQHQYMVLYQCMQRDYFWIFLTVILDIAVACGYAVIATHWWKNARTLPATPAKRALGNIRNIFVFCGICGYAFIPIKMLWPAWRLYDLFMGVLVYFTWKYAWRARDLKVVYSELGRSTQLAEDLERSREQTEQKNFFLNALSHDLRTPLNGLALQASLAEMSLDANDIATLKVALADIRASTTATSELLDRLLEFGRAGVRERQPAQLEDFALGALLEELANRFRGAAERKGLRIDVRESNGLLVRSDRLTVSRVLANLLDNAIKFTDHGSVRVEVDCAESGTEIHVIDTGIGISPADSARLFEEFYQVHNNERDRSKGFGIGLAIARRLARQLGGDVLLESAPGSGSRFSLVIPRVAPDRSSSETGLSDQQRVTAPRAAGTQVAAGAR